MKYKHRTQIIFIMFLIFILANSKSFAAPDAGSLLKHEEEIYKFNEAPSLKPKKLPQKEKRKKNISGANKIYVKNFKFIGEINKFNPRIFENLLKNFINKENTFEDLKYAASLIQKFYLENGYFLAQAFLPEQEVSDQVITIKIIEGHLDKNKPYILKKNNVRLFDDLVSNYLNDALGSGLTSQSLERALLNLNNLPGLKASSTITPGDEKDSSKIVVNLVEDDLVNRSISYDNYGNRYTGKQRTNISLSINNPSKYGDQLSFQTIFNKSSNYDFSKITYEFPILYSGLRSKITYSELEFEIGQELRTNPSSIGEASTSSINFSYPLKLTSSNSIFLKTDYQSNEIYNEAIGTVTNDKVIENYNIGLTYEKRDIFRSGDISLFSIDTTFGDLDLSKVSLDYNNDQAASGAKKHGPFNKTLINYYYSQRINEKINFKTYGLAQLSNKNLDSSEQISLGGITGVRAYPSGEASGDQGYKFAAELQTNLSEFLNYNISGTLFYDYGRIQQYKDSSNIILTTPNKYSLSGWGVGFDYNPNQDLSLQLVLSKTIGGNAGESSTGMDSDGRDDSSRASLLLSFDF